MKYLFPVGLLLVGLSVGYVVGVNSTENSSNGQVVVADSITTKVVYDTIVTNKIVEVSIESVNKTVIDTLNLLDSSKANLIQLDTLMEIILEKSTDSLVEEEININKDKRISKINLNINYLNIQLDKDSLIKSSLDINDVINQTLIIEFWESPVNYSGYKLSKYKLILYGLSPQFDYKIYKKDKIYYLNFQSIFYEMVETTQFLPYFLIDESKVLND
jgi:hypothetical protein